MRATYWFLFLLFMHQGSQWVHLHICVYLSVWSKDQRWMIFLEMLIHVSGHNSFCPNISCFSAPPCRSCCSCAQPAAVKWESELCLSWEQATKHDTNLTFHPLCRQIRCFYTASSLGRTEVERTDSFLTLQLVQDVVQRTHQISAEVPVSKLNHVRTVYKSRRNREES